MIRKDIIELSRELRKRMTPEEKNLWKLLRGRQLHGYKFLRQHPIIYKEVQNRIYFFIVDFYCANKNLIIELDGKIHEEQLDYDEFRDDIIKNLGYNIIRIKNDELKEIDQVLNRISSFLINKE